jgi:hypothetical protein
VNREGDELWPANWMLLVGSPAFRVHVEKTTNRMLWRFSAWLEALRAKVQRHLHDSYSNQDTILYPVDPGPDLSHDIHNYGLLWAIDGQRVDAVAEIAIPYRAQ